MPFPLLVTSPLAARVVVTALVGSRLSFGSVSAFDRHLSPAGCRPVSEFGAPRGQAGTARLVPENRSLGEVWVTARRGPKKPLPGTGLPRK